VEKGVRPVVLRSANPRVFGASLDLPYLLSLSDSELAQFVAELNRAFFALFTFPR
jgi:enoyl-CoA hydratase/carnithine racemase